MKTMTKETAWINPVEVYWDTRHRAEKLGATIVLSSDHDEIHEHNKATHFAPFCTTNNSSDKRGNTPYLIELESILFNERTQEIEKWIADELEYKRQKGY